MKSQADKMLDMIQQNDKMAEMDKIGGPGKENFVSGLIDIPTLLQKTKQLKSVCIRVQGDPFDMMTYAKLLIDNTTLYTMQEYDTDTTILNSLDFKSIVKSSKYSNGYSQGDEKVERKSIVFKMAFAAKGIMRKILSFSETDLVFLSLSRDQTCMNLSIFYKKYNIKNLIPYDDKVLKEVFIKLMTYEGDTQIHERYFTEEMVQMYTKMTTVYTSRSRMKEFYIKQQEGKGHVIFRKNPSTDLRKFIYQGGQTGKEKEGLFVIEDDKGAVEEPKKEIKEKKLEPVIEKKEIPKIEIKRVEIQEPVVEEKKEIIVKKPYVDEEEDIKETKDDPVKKDDPKQVEMKKLEKNLQLANSDVSQTPESQRSRIRDASLKSLRTEKKEKEKKVVEEPEAKAEESEVEAVMVKDEGVISLNSKKLIGKRPIFTRHDELSDSDKDYTEEIVSKIGFKAHFEPVMIEKLRKMGVKGRRPDFEYNLMSLGEFGRLSANQKSMVKYAVKNFSRNGPQLDNEEILDMWLKKQFDHFAKHEDFLKWKYFLDMVFKKMFQKKWFLPILFWCLNEVLKSNRDKYKCKRMNLVLVVYGASGVGKTSFARWLLNPIFKTMNIEVGEYIYQHPQLASDKIKILVSPDDASPNEIYLFTQVVQGEVSLQIKKENTPLNTMYKSGLVLTNLQEEKVYDEVQIDKSFEEKTLMKKNHSFKY